ncbi:LysR family transcriptional regulator [Bradyrhizobium genosp. P]|uniref:LysR family transcriptional regulator n=1 Tax=Bradyrhizobium genosp. P TaxID=83641 RepID=UPI003CEC3291
MEIRTLRAFVEVVRQGGFSQAAKVVFATQSTVSKAVKQLEDEIGVLLLDRAGHRSTLTAAGEIVYRRALRILAERDDLLSELDEVRGLKRGLLRLGLPPMVSSTLFAPLFAIYRKRYPGIDISLVENGSDRLEEILFAGDLDFAASTIPVADSLECQSVRREPLVALLPAREFATRKKCIDLADLKQMPFIMFDSSFAISRLVVDACGRAGFEPTVSTRSSQLDFVMELVAAGMGVAFLPKMVAEQQHHPGLRSLLLVNPKIDWHIGMTWRRGAYLSHAAKAWLMLVREQHGD